MILYCDQCGNYHESVTACGRSVQIPAPLPPIAEQTSIARFNALADQIRELSGNLQQVHSDLAKFFHLEFVDLRTKLDRMILDGKLGYDAVMRTLAKPNVAVAKKKAAPLVGKKGTGRKG